ncbi:hypothetical protein, partial [Peribacillus frigoritolerans]|uniref:hypothetical protein n=1 Tax=Peribacillus frigoritolerans TaxID=450367 RepID=UPI002E1C4BF9|nr:hypothetical protein [Peribacillus frigoritolerans]
SLRKEPIKKRRVDSFSLIINYINIGGNPATKRQSKERESSIFSLKKMPGANNPPPWHFFCLENTLKITVRLYYDISISRNIISH